MKIVRKTAMAIQTSRQDKKIMFAIDAHQEHCLLSDLIE